MPNQIVPLGIPACVWRLTLALIMALGAAAASGQDGLPHDAADAARGALEDVKIDGDALRSFNTPDELSEVLYFEQPSPAASPRRIAAPPRATSGGNVSRRDPRSLSRSRRFDLVSTPAMLGDFYLGGGNLLADDGLLASTDIPLAGGAGRLRVGDNNKALPVDRIIFMYNHFNNAIEADASQFLVGPDRRRFSVDRYTAGIEKTFFEEMASVQVQLPLTGNLEFSTPNFSVVGGNLGNLQIITKLLLHGREDLAVSCGIGFDVPTGNDASGHVNIALWSISNDALHVSPYFAATYLPTEDWFANAFLAVDVPTIGNRVVLSSALPFLPPPIGGGRLNEQTLLEIDLSLGRWLYRNAEATCLTGIAGIVEAHYTSTLSDADDVSAADFITNLSFREIERRRNILDLTIGAHVEFTSNTELRVGAVFPLTNFPDRTFDSEIQAFVVHRF